MYAPAPPPEELAAIGITVEDIQDESDIEVWEENWDAVQVFSSMDTQWTSGPGGPIGLNYQSLEAVFKAHGIKKKRRAELFFELQIMEREALNQMTKK